MQVLDAYMRMVHVESQAYIHGVLSNGACTMEIKKSLLINAPIEKVWDILANDYAQVGSWTAVIHTSEAIHGERLPGAPTYGPVCDPPDRDCKERITHTHDTNRALASQFA